MAYLQIISVKNFRSLSIIRLAIHLSRNKRKWMRNAENEQYIAGYFAPLFSNFAPLFSLFVFHSISHRNWHMRKNLKDFLVYFCGINKTQNSHKMRKVYSECFIFHCVLWRTLVKCKMRKVYSQPNRYAVITGKREVCNSPERGK